MILIIALFDSGATKWVRVLLFSAPFFSLEICFQLVILYLAYKTCKPRDVFFLFIQFLCTCWNYFNASAFVWCGCCVLLEPYNSMDDQPTRGMLCNFWHGTTSASDLVGFSICVQSISTIHFYLAAWEDLARRFLLSTRLPREGRCLQNMLQEVWWLQECHSSCVARGFMYSTEATWWPITRKTSQNLATKANSWQQIELLFDDLFQYNKWDWAWSKKRELSSSVTWVASKRERYTSTFWETWTQELRSTGLVLLVSGWITLIVRAIIGMNAEPIDSLCHIAQVINV